MRSKHRLDTELEELAGSERERPDLEKSSIKSSISKLLNAADAQAEELFRIYPRALDRFIKKGAEWYRKKDRRMTTARRSETEFKSSG